MGDESRARSREEIIVRFREGGALTVVQGRIVASELSLERFLQTMSGISGGRLYRSYPGAAERIRDLRDRAASRLGRKVPLRDRFVRISAPSGGPQTARIRSLLPANARPGVFRATLDEWCGPRHLGRITIVLRPGEESSGDPEDPGP